MNKKKWYEVPTQVTFYDVENDVIHGGIAYQDYIICGCCGGAIPLDDEEIDIKEELSWIDISDEIKGDL